MLKLKLRQDTIDKKTNENKTDITIKENTSNENKSLSTNTSFKKGQEFYKEAVNELKKFLNNELICESSLETLSLFEHSQLRFSTIHVANNYSIKNEINEESKKQEKISNELEKIDELKNVYSLNLDTIEKDFKDLTIKVDSDNLSLLPDTGFGSFYPLLLEIIEKSKYIESKHNERKELINDIFGSENVNFRIEAAAEKKYNKEAETYTSIYFDLKKYIR